VLESCGGCEFDSESTLAPPYPASAHARAMAGLALLGAALALACASRGAPFAIDRIPDIRPGATTRHEIAGWFGPPSGVEAWGSGETTWYYLHEERSERDTQTASRALAWLASLFRVYSPIGIRPPVNVVSGLTTIHELEIFLGADGVVYDYRYERDEIRDRRVY